MRRALRGVLGALLLSACGGAREAPTRPEGRTQVRLSLVGTSDLHGRLAALPWLGGHLRNLRAARARDGAVLVLDGGDLFQGTVESNLEEGAGVIRAYNALGYAAAAVGNHEFDYGPEGPDSFARRPEQDPRGALRARIREARFPFLTANILREPDGQPLDWENLRSEVVLSAGGARVGVLGLSTESTPATTLTLNFRGLRMRPVAAALRERAAALRAQGVDAVVVVAHLGGACRDLAHPEDTSSCEADQELFRVLREVPRGLVDVVVAGHTHQAVAHVVEGVAVVQSFAMGRAFGRVDLLLDVRAHRVLERTLFPPRAVCADFAREETNFDRCAPAPYEGAPVRPEQAVAEAIAPSLAAARAARERPLGVTVLSPVRTAYRDESALPNLLAELSLRAAQGADVALVNNGGVRVDFPAGELRYGQLYATLPFDNRLVTLRMRGDSLASLLLRSVTSEAGGALSVAGVRVRVSCYEGRPRAELERPNGRPVGAEELLTVATNDFLATGTLRAAAQGEVTEEAIAAAPVLRDALEAGLRAESPLRGEDPRWFDPAHPRLVLPSPRPVRCQ